LSTAGKLERTDRCVYSPTANGLRWLEGIGKVRIDSPDVPCEPFAMIGGKRVQFDFSGGAVLRPIDEPGGAS
jgi:hypothetical protein